MTPQVLNGRYGRRSPCRRRSSARSRVFTQGIGTWWPPKHHILEAELAKMVFEPRVGGNIYDRASTAASAGGHGCSLTSRPTASYSAGTSAPWQIETDPEKASEDEVRFTSEGPDGTHVELEHRDLNRHREGWQAMRDALGSLGGWNLERFAEVAAAG